MRITKWGECGILCALALARRYGEPAIGAVDIAESEQLDVQYTQQILQRLRKGGIIESVRGPHGGYRLSRPPTDTNLREILYAVEGDTFKIICDSAPIHPTADLSAQCSDKDSCGLHGVWQELRVSIDGFLESKTLASLLAFDGEREQLVQLSRRPEPV